MIAIFDIGGTNFRAAIYQNKKIIKIEKIPTPNYLKGFSINAINNHILDLIFVFIKKNEGVNCIGVCFAGPVSKNGVIWGSSVIYGKKILKNFNLRNEIIKKTKIDNVYVVNDLFAASWRYINQYNKFLLVTVSSGIGNKIVINKEVQIGDDGFEGELGHIRAIGCEEINIKCDCGWGINHIGSISSGRGIENIANKYKNTVFNKSYLESSLQNNKYITIYDIAKAADMSDVFANEIIDYCTKPLAYTFCSLLASLYLDKIILMGGFVQNCNSYIKYLVKNMIDFGIYNFNSDMIKEKIIIGYNDDEHGLYGLISYLDSKYCMENIQ